MFVHELLTFWIIVTKKTIIELFLVLILWENHIKINWIF